VALLAFIKKILILEMVEDKVCYSLLALCYRSSIMRKRLWIYLFRNKLKVFTIIWIILSVNIYQQRKSQSTYIELDNAAEKSLRYKQSQLPETKTEPLRIKSSNKEANSFQPFSPYDKPLDNSVYGK